MESKGLQGMLQAAVQSVQWTYCLFWHFCPRQGALVWGDGCYNGAIKTRKTVQPSEATAEEAAVQRSQQLRDLYDSLIAAADTKRPSTALSPEDLTQSEWFYLMCVSFSFPPSSGLPGKAYARKQHVWLSGANEVDSKTFSRAILAKSAKIQTVVCIPVLDGVVELGTTDKVKEDLGFIYHIKNFFNEQSPTQSKPALSEHSTSNPSSFRSSSLPPTLSYIDHPDHDDGEEEDDDDDDYDYGDDGVATADPSKLMQLDAMSVEDVQFGSPDEISNNLDSELHLLAVSCSPTHHLNTATLQPRTSEWAITTEEEDGNYSQTVSTILRALRSDSLSWLPCDGQSSFARWNMDDAYVDHNHAGRVSQSVLKYIIFSVPFLHAKHRSPDEINANHVVAERRRREKLNERFITLRAMVPFVTKMDKVSILGDTIEYVKQLRTRIQDLEGEKHHQKRMRPSRRANGSKNSEATEMVEVSIIESDALLEMRCEYREGLLIDVLEVLRDLRIETTAVHSTVNGRVFTAEIRAKVKDNSRGKKVSIVDVKTAIHHILPL